MENRQETEELKIPDILPLLPVRDVVVYPYMILPLFVGREISIAAVDFALSKDRLIFLATQKDIGDEEPAPEAILVCFADSSFQISRSIKPSTRRSIAEALGT